MKKLATILLTLALSFSLTIPALAAPAGGEAAAWRLYSMGLFLGTGIDAEGFPIFSLEDAPTRAEG